MDFVIFGDYIALPRSLGFQSLSGLGVSYGVDKYWGNYNFGVFLCFQLFYCFLVRDGWFIDFVILGDSIALRWCIGF